MEATPLTNAIRKQVNDVLASMREEAAVKAAWETAHAVTELAMGWPLVAAYHSTLAERYALFADSGTLPETREAGQALAAPMPWRLWREVRRRDMYGMDKAQWCGGAS